MKRQSALRRRSSQAAARSRSFRRGRGFEQLEERHLLAAITWDGGAGTLNWSDASNWDTDTVPTSADDVSIGDLAGPVLIGGTTSAASITSAETLSVTGGTLTTTATVDVTGTAGVNLNSGTLVGGTWTVAGTFSANNSANNRLENVAVNGNVRLATTSAKLKVYGATTFDTIELAGNFVSLSFGPGVTILGDITSSGTSNSIGVDGDGTVIVGEDSTLTSTAASIAFGAAGDTIVNQGTIVSNGGVFTIGGDTFTNDDHDSDGVGAKLHANGGSLSINPTTWAASNGRTEVSSGFLSLNGAKTPASLNVAGFSRTGGTVLLGGTLDIGVDPLALSPATGSWELSSGVVTGGEIALTDGVTLGASNSANNRLENVAVNGNVRLATTSAKLKVYGATTFDTIELAGNFVSLSFGPGVTILGDITSSGTSNSIGVDGDGTVTVGEDSTLTSTAASIAFGAAGDTIVNQGTIVSNGGVFTIGGDTFTNDDHDSDGVGAKLHANGGSLSINPTTWAASNGRTEVSSGFLSLNGAKTPASLNVAGFSRTGGTVLLGGTLDIGVDPLALSPATGSWELSSGVVTGGEIALTDGVTLGASNSANNRLENVAVNGNVRLATTSAKLKVYGATTFDTIELAGNFVSLSFGPGVTILGDITSSGTSNSIGVDGDGTVTVGEDSTLTSTAASIAFGAAGDTIVNQGTIVSNGGVFTIGGDTFTNSGVVSAEAGSISVMPTPTNYSSGTLTGGTWKAAGSGLMALPAGTDITVLDANLVIDTTGVGIRSGSSPVIDVLAPLTTIASNGLLEIGPNRNQPIPTALTSFGELIVNGTLTVPSVTTEAGSRVSGDGTISGPVTANAAAVVAPGNTLTAGILKTPDVLLADGSTLELAFGGAMAGNTAADHDQLQVTGTVTIGANVSLETLSLSGSSLPTYGDEAIVVDNDDVDPVIGTFAGLPEGGIINDFAGVVGYDAVITYVGGDGNDIAISPVPRIDSISLPRLEGSNIDLVGTGVDPAAPGLSLSFEWDFGDGSATENGTNTTTAPSTVTNDVGHTYTDNGIYTVQLTVFVADGGSASRIETFTVANVAPTAMVGNDGPVDEASPVNVSLSGGTDVSSDDLAAGLKYSFALSIGELAGDYASAGLTDNADYTFSDNGTYTVFARVFDKDEGFTDYQTTVTVDNVAPTIDTLNIPNEGMIIELLDFSAVASDPGADDLTYEWDFGDGSPLQMGDSATYAYSSPGTFLVTVEVTDDDGAMVTGSQTIEITALACDFDLDGDCDGADVDLLQANIVNGPANPAIFDLTGDGAVTVADRDEWLALAGAENLPSGNAYLLGDANLDGVVDVSDFNIWNDNKFRNNTAWTAADFNVDGVVDVSDFNIWNIGKFTSSNPRPTTAGQPDHSSLFSSREDDDRSPLPRHQDLVDELFADLT